MCCAVITKLFWKSTVFILLVTQCLFIKMPGTCKNIDTLKAEIISCRRCPRLVAWRENIAKTKRKAFAEWEYWGKPVPGFGDIKGRILILGLAPGAHGSNRTGRMFTGDASGDFLFPALFKAGFASQPEAHSINDGLDLKGVYISAVCRCAPPDNKPTNEEISFCQSYLMNEIELMKNLSGIVALGKIAFDSAIKLILRQSDKIPTKKPKFGHGELYFCDSINCPWLLTSYHPSRQNTQTGRLTQPMFQMIWDTVKKLT